MSESVSKPFEAERANTRTHKEQEMNSSNDHMPVITGNSIVRKDESSPQAESAVGRVPRAVPAWDYNRYPDGKLPYA